MASLLFSGRQRDGGGAADVGAVVVEEAVGERVDGGAAAGLTEGECGGDGDARLLVAGAQSQCGRGLGVLESWASSGWTALVTEIGGSVGRSAERKLMTDSRMASPPVWAARRERPGQEFGVGLGVA